MAAGRMRIVVTQARRFMLPSNKKELSHTMSSSGWRGHVLCDMPRLGLSDEMWSSGWWDSGSSAHILIAGAGQSRVFEREPIEKVSKGYPIS